MASKSGDSDSFKSEVRNSLINILDEKEQLLRITAYLTRVTALNTGKREENLDPDATFASLSVSDETASEIRNLIAHELNLFLSKSMFQEKNTIRSVAGYVREALTSDST